MIPDFHNNIQNMNELVFTFEMNMYFYYKVLSVTVSIVYLYLQAKSASETIEQIRTSVLVTLEQNVQVLFDTVLGSQGLQTKLAAVEKAVRNGTLAGTVSSHYCHALNLMLWPLSSL
jgi:hypothetical protein